MLLMFGESSSEFPNVWILGYPVWMEYRSVFRPKT